MITGDNCSLSNPAPIPGIIGMYYHLETVMILRKGNMTKKNSVVATLGRFAVAVALIGYCAAPVLAESESGGFIMGGGNESGGVYNSGAESESGGVYNSGAESESGGVYNNGAESESGGLAEVGASSESGGVYGSGAESETGGLYSTTAPAPAAFDPQYGIKTYKW